MRSALKALPMQEEVAPAEEIQKSEVMPDPWELKPSTDHGACCNKCCSISFRTAASSGRRESDEAVF
jgi:hypothetical protein